MKETRLDTFDAKCTSCGEKVIAEVEIYDDKYISLLNKNFNSVQQLKAEIAAIAEVVADDKTNGGGCVVNLRWLLKELRQLSAWRTNDTN